MWLDKWNKSELKKTANARNNANNQATNKKQCNDTVIKK